jgi:hypothetical protein
MNKITNLILGTCLLTTIIGCDVEAKHQEKLQNQAKNLNKLILADSSKTIAITEYIGSQRLYKKETRFMDHDGDKKTVEETITVYYTSGSNRPTLGTNHLIRDSSIDSWDYSNSTRVMTPAEADSIDNLYQTLMEIGR